MSQYFACGVLVNATTASCVPLEKLVLVFPVLDNLGPTRRRVLGCNYMGVNEKNVDSVLYNAGYDSVCQSVNSLLDTYDA
jgi:hypothetical protein